jgi:hypothetical protein
MTWYARYVGPGGIQASGDAPTWEGGMNVLRVFLEAACPEGFYLAGVRTMQSAPMQCDLSFGDGRHTIMLRKGSPPVGLPSDQTDLFGPRA